MPQLREVSERVAGREGSGGKGLFTGLFRRELSRRVFPAASSRRQGRIVAFANLWESAPAGELSIDLMRFSADAPKGVMDYLFVELMLWGKSQGYTWFSLGMAPLAGLERHRLAPPWHKLGRLVYRYGENFYNFEGLRQYKDKFHPKWEPRYLAAPGGMALPRVLLDVTSLIARRPAACGTAAARSRHGDETTRDAWRLCAAA